LKDPGAVADLVMAMGKPVAVGCIAATRYIEVPVDRLAEFDWHRRAVGKRSGDRR
jgi:hypothetical protein